MARTTNIRIPVGGAGETLGAWFMEPVSDERSDRQPVLVVYMHGNAETRSQHHRRELYKIYQRLGYNVLAFDYRGYADSSPAWPGETSMAEDAMAALDYARAKALAGSDATIVVHGHSLGTGVAARVAASMAHSSRWHPSAYVLESPFNSMLDEVYSFKVTRLLSALGVDVAGVLKAADCRFDSQFWFGRAGDAHQPVLILHALDDGTIPHDLALKLKDSLTTSRSGSVQMVSFPSSLGWGHNDIYKDPTLPSILKEFIEERIMENEKK